MKTKNIILFALLVLLTSMASCKKDPDIPTGQVFNASGGGEEPGGGNTSYDFVDLGLPSGTLWAICNVGATSPEDYGNYYAWGETSIKSIYNWNNYKYCNGDYNKLTKYCNNSAYGNNGFTDNLTKLQANDDAATINWGKDWCMPTKEEWQELFDNTTCIWTTRHGVNGRLFTATNGNSLFLPAAGYQWYEEPYSVSNIGHYWSSSLNTDESNASWRFMLTSDEYGIIDAPRFSGFSVRAVRSVAQNYSISASAIPSNGGTVSGSGIYQQGQICTVTATANNGYAFINWTENGKQVSTDANYSFTVMSDRTLVANFTLCDYSNIILNELNGDTKFIEIYNKGDFDIPLEDMYIMKDDYAAGAIWTSDATVVAPAHGYVVLYSVDVQADHPELNENQFFNSGISSKKTIRLTLFMSDGTVRDEFTRGTTGEWGLALSNVAPQSYARTPDGGDWKLAAPTPGAANPATGEDIPQE